MDLQMKMSVDTLRERGSIYAEEGATVIVENNGATATLIADADTALNFSDGANYNVINSNFTNNYVGMHLYNYIPGVAPKPNNNSIDNIFGNTFSSVSTLKTPPVGSASAYGICGISLNYTENIQIGKRTATVLTPNIFNNLYSGIIGVNACGTIINNQFTNIQAAGWQAAGSGVYAYSDEDYNDRTINAGELGDNDKGNYFSDCINGIFAVGDLNLNIFNNNANNITAGFNNIDNYSIGILYNPNGSISIADNLIENVHTGIGIKIENATQTDKVVNIYDNEITDLQTGIDIKKINGVKIYKVATGNTISFHLGTGSLTSNYFGISLDHCDDVFVHENTISNNSANTSTSLRGLNVSTAQYGNICSNEITNMGYSMFFDDDCENTKLKLNKMAGYSRAIYFNSSNTNTKFSPQGDGSTTWDNEFETGNANYRLDGTLYQTGNINWYHKSGNLDISPFNVAKINSINCSGCSGTTICDVLPSRNSSNTVLSNNDSSIDFNLFPNPANDELFIEIKNFTDGNYIFSVIDNLGRIVLTKRTNLSLTDFDISNLKNGIYLIRLFQENYSIQSKSFIINR